MSRKDGSQSQAVSRSQCACAFPWRSPKLSFFYNDVFHYILLQIARHQTEANEVTTHIEYEVALY
jgi:hypothetical protein